MIQASRAVDATGQTRLLTPPEVILFDWHATLVDTLDAVYHAVDDMLPQLDALGLRHRLVRTRNSKTPEDAKLVRFVRIFRRLHPKIKRERKVSRTDIFEVLFGNDEQAKQIAHNAFNAAYQQYYGEVRPFRPGIREVLEALRDMGIRLGIPTNRNRRFLERELELIDGGRWAGLFEVIVCGDDVPRRKPAPDALLKAMEKLGVAPGPAVWFVGDSTTDTVAAKNAGITSIFFNGAGWPPEWISKIFPGTAVHPHQPDAVVDDFQQLLALVRSLR